MSKHCMVPSPASARPGSPALVPPADMGVLATRMSLLAQRHRDAVARGDEPAAALHLLEVRGLLAAARGALHADPRSDSRTLGLILQCIRAGEVVLAGCTAC